MQRLALLGLMLLALTAAGSACSVAARQATITCAEGETVRFRPGIVQEMPGRQQQDRNLSTVLDECSSPPPEELVREAVKNWNSNWDGYFTGSKMAIEPYSQERMTELRAQRHKIDNCYYRAFERDGRWIVSWADMYSFCSLEGGAGGMCPHTERSHIGVVAYLLAHPSVDNAESALPSLLFILVLLTPLLVFTVRPASRPAFTPNRWNIGATLLAAPVAGLLLFLPYTPLPSLLPDILFLLGGVYLTGSVLTYIINLYRASDQQQEET